MKTSRTIILLSSLAAMLALIAACAGLFWPGGAGPFTFTTLHGQTVQMSGRGLYGNDTLFAAAAYRGTDAVTLIAAIPMLVLALLLYGRGSLRGLFLLLGALAFFLYNSASMALVAIWFTAALFRNITDPAPHRRS